MIFLRFGQSYETSLPTGAEADKTQKLSVLKQWRLALQKSSHRPQRSSAADKIISFGVLDMR